MDEHGDIGAPARAKRKRGATQRQRLALEPPVYSSLANYLVQSWTWGQISPQTMQAIASAAQLDIANAIQRHQENPLDQRGLPSLAMLAGLGASGLYPRNMHEELTKKLVVPKLQAPVKTIVPVAHTKSPAGYQMQEHSVFYPHEMFASVYKDYPTAWRRRIMPSTAKLNEFWNLMEGNPVLADHPVKSVENYKTRAIPIMLHGDGVPTVGVGKAWSKSLEILSWTSVFGEGTTTEFTFYICSMFKELESKHIGGNTWRTIWRRIHWSLYWLWKGVWPRTDEFGKPWPSRSVEASRAGADLCPVGGRNGNGYFAVLWGVKGDLDWVYDKLKLADYRALSQGPCALCPCNNTNMLWSDLRQRNACWIPHIYAAQDQRVLQTCVCVVWCLI